MGFRPYNPAGGSGGSGARVPVLISGSPYATLADLQAYSQANQSELLNNSNDFSTAVANEIMYEWQGENGVYASGGWVSQNALTGAQAMAVQSIIDLPNNAIPRGLNGELVESNAAQDGEGVDVTGRLVANDLQSDRDSVDIGEILRLSEDGGRVRLVDTTLLQSFYPAGSPENTDRSLQRAFRTARTAETEVTLQPDKSETNTGNYSFQSPVTFNRNITELTIEVDQDVTGVRLVLRESAEDGKILFQSHTTQEWENGGGYTLAADTEEVLEFLDSARVDTTIPLFVTFEKFTNPNEFVIKGATIGGTFLPFLRQKYTIQSQIMLADAADITQPLGYATINNFERINGGWESMGNVQLDNVESQINTIEVVAIKANNSASNHDFRIVYGGTDATHAGEIYYTGSLTSSVSGSYLIAMAATATAIPNEDDVVLESQAMRNSGSRVDHQSTMIKYQERS